MPKRLKLSELINEIDDVIQDRFAGETFWIAAEITDVKKASGQALVLFKVY